MFAGSCLSAELDDIQVEHVVLESTSHIVSADDGRRILHVAFLGKHHYSHGTRMVTQLAAAVASERPSGVLVDLLKYDYEFGNDVGGLFFAGRHKESGTIVPTCIVAIGRTRAGMESLYVAGALKLEPFLGFAASVAEGMTWLGRTPAPRQWSQELILDWSMVKALIGRLVDAWNRGDADGFAGMFAPHAEYVTGQGQRIWGREGIAELVRQAGPGSQIAVLGGPSVECDGNAGKARFSWATADQGTAARQGVTTCTLIRENTRWMIETLRTEERRHPE